MRLFYYYNHPVLREMAFLLPPLFEWRSQTSKTAISMFVEISDVPPRRLLDVGCGTGVFTRRLARYFPNTRIDAIDITPRMIDFAVKKNTFKGRVRFSVMDFMKVTGRYDAVFALYTIMLLPLREAVSRLVSLTPDGVAVFNLTIPNLLMKLHRAFYSVVMGSIVNLYPVSMALDIISEVADIADVRQVMSSEGTYLIAIRRKR